MPPVRVKKQNLASIRGRKVHLPRYHLNSPAQTGALCPDHHPGLAVTGSPVPVYSPRGFLRQYGQTTSVRVGWGSFQPGASFSGSFPLTYSSWRSVFTCSQYYITHFKSRRRGVIHGWIGYLCCNRSRPRAPAKICCPLLSSASLFVLFSILPPWVLDPNGE